MTDELRDKFRALVADAPPPTGVPSDAVFARIRTVRRRRATGAVAGLTTAAVAAIAFAAGNVTGVDSAPPVTHTPNGPAPVVTVTRTQTATSAPTVPRPSISVSAAPLGPSETARSTPPPSGTPKPPPVVDPTPPPSSTTTTATTSAPEPKPKTRVRFWFYPKVEGLTVTLFVDAAGVVLEPVPEEGGELGSSAFHDNLFNGIYWWGDGTVQEEDKDAGISCTGAKKVVDHKGIEQIGTPHTYKKPGLYGIAYRVTYCTPDGPRQYTHVQDVPVPGPSASPSP
ncbi:hypothetical protein Kfla_5576 [Kribbella flavida DSM 17836]|uniref:Uncharacterized protein n=1 Tax=Kribbella flavida (strain DSM 17836 / JCM 10339 / NBRC 14399) TaxID=479435 RepID=D2PN98_KRIFD|nr:hypothetical protein [Kribbella flavida]ADB34582.1 hypothetical protein Kfla_5576 [Kribbella flavida DSM 17836]